jgi:hypothetical protein
MTLLGTGGGSTTLLQDNFVDVSGTNLTAHVMNVGPGWTVTDGSYQIQGNAARCTGTGASSYGVAIADAGKSDGTATVTATLDAGAASRHGLAVRATNGNNHWRVTIKASGEFAIVEVNGGTATVRASAAVTINTGTGYTIQCAFSGTTLTATLNGGNQISYSSATLNQTTTTHGLDDGASGECSFTNFQVTNP